MNACCPFTFPLPFGPVAQRLEQGTHNPLVGGSIPPGPSYGKPSHRYRDFIEGIKLGLPWEDALKKAYGLTPADLVRLYGQTIGIPDLRP